MSQATSYVSPPRLGTPPKTEDISLGSNPIPISSSLLSLPYELRQIIWQYLFTDYPITIEPAGIELQSHMNLSIVYTCKLLHAETVHHVYRSSTIHFTDPLVVFRFAFYVGSDLALEILHVHFDVSNVRHFNQTYTPQQRHRLCNLARIRTVFPCLRTITSNTIASRWPTISAETMLDGFNQLLFTNVSSKKKLYKYFKHALNAPGRILDETVQSRVRFVTVKTGEPFLRHVVFWADSQSRKYSYIDCRIGPSDLAHWRSSWLIYQWMDSDAFVHRPGIPCLNCF